MKTCVVDGCPRARKVRGFHCSMHANRVWRFGTTELPPRPCKICGALIPRERRAQYCDKECLAAAQPRCSEKGCERPRQARGLCGSHYNRAHQPDRYRRELVTCAQPGCGLATLKSVDTRRPRRFCSDLCRDLAVTARWSTAVPDTHPSRSTVVPADHPSRAPIAIPRPTRDCDWCGTRFTFRRYVDRYCSRRCKVRAVKVRRKARESDGHTYSWTAVMRVLLLFGGCCPYCEQMIDGPPDPDHVVPLSRGGSNGISNILPCCRACNSDKRDLLLSEWNGDRERRGLPLRTTSWPVGDPRIAHLNRSTALPHAA